MWVLRKLRFMAVVSRATKFSRGDEASARQKAGASRSNHVEPKQATVCDAKTLAFAHNVWVFASVHWIALVSLNGV